MQQVDAEIRRIIDEQYKVAYDILNSNRDKMETMTNALMEWETIDRDQVLEIMDGKAPSPPKDYSHNLRQDDDSTPDSAAPVAAGTAAIPAGGDAVVGGADSATIGPEADPQPQPNPQGPQSGDVVSGGEGQDQPPRHNG